MCANAFASPFSFLKKTFKTIVVRRPITFSLSLTFAASFLESKMVCTPEDLRSSEATMSASGSLGRNSFEATEDSHSSGLLRTQDLQEAKDQIIVEVADTLGVPLYSAENLLSQNFWSREAVLEKWRAEQQAASTSQQPSQPLMDTTNSRSSEMQQQQSVAVASSSSTAGTTTKTFATHSVESKRILYH